MSLADGEDAPPAEGFFEFPDDRARLLSLLANRSALIVSGDVHYAELSAYACAGGRTVPEQIDWTVVYWNLVDIKNDLTRGARRAAWRHRWALGAAAAAGIAYAVTRP